MRFAMTVGAGLALVWGCSSQSTENGRFQATGGDAGVVTSNSGSGGSHANSSTSKSASSSSASSVSASSAATSGSGCADPGEPNDSEDKAVQLPPETDCDGTSMLTGTLVGSDVDWYKYAGTDKLGCVVDPARTLSADGQVRLCKYASCLGAAVTCPAGTTAQKSPKGLDGCCGQQGFKIGINCKGINDNATIYLYLDKPSSPNCTSYTVTYHY